MKTTYMVDWAITNKCNLKCMYCRGMTFYELSTNEAINLAKEIEKLRPGWIIIEGGEPFLRKDLWKILKYLNSKKYLITNGTIINEDIIENIKKLNIRVLVSIDAADKNSFERIRVGANFDEVINNTKRYIKEGLLEGINFTLGEYNCNEIESVFVLCKNLGIKKINSIGLKPSKENNYYFLKNFGKTIEKICNCSIKYEIEVFFDEPFFLPYVIENKLNVKTGKCGGIVVDDIKGCIFGEYIFIEPDGEVKPCTFSSYSIGNAKDGIANLWKEMQNSKFFAKIKLYREGYCSSCKYFTICGGCRSRSFYFTKNWFSSDPLCPLKL